MSKHPWCSISSRLKVSGVLRACLWRGYAGRALPAGGGTLNECRQSIQGYLPGERECKMVFYPCRWVPRFSVSFSDESVRCVCGFICRNRLCCIGLGGPHVYVCGLWCNLKAADSNSMLVQRGQTSSKEYTTKCDETC